MIAPRRGARKGFVRGKRLRARAKGWRGQKARTGLAAETNPPSVVRHFYRSESRLR
jgi:hypothetical protein